MKFTKNQTVYTRMVFTAGNDTLPKNSQGIVQDSFVVNNNNWYVVDFGQGGQSNDWAIDEPDLSNTSAHH